MLVRVLFFIGIFPGSFHLNAMGHFEIPTKFLCVDNNNIIALRSWKKEGEYVVQADLEHKYNFLVMSKIIKNNKLYLTGESSLYKLIIHISEINIDREFNALAYEESLTLSTVISTSQHLNCFEYH